MADTMQVAVGNSNFVSSATGLDEGPVSRVHEIKTPKVSSTHEQAISVPYRPLLAVVGREGVTAAASLDQRVCDRYSLSHRQTPHLCGANWGTGNMGKPLSLTR